MHECFKVHAHKTLPEQLNLLLGKQNLLIGVEFLKRIKQPDKHKYEISIT